MLLWINIVKVTVDSSVNRVLTRIDGLTREETVCWYSTFRIYHRRRRRHYHRHRLRRRIPMTRNDGDNNESGRPQHRSPGALSWSFPWRPQTRHPRDRVKTCGKRPTVRSRIVDVAAGRGTRTDDTALVEVRSRRLWTPVTNILLLSSFKDFSHVPAGTSRALNESREIRY